MWTIVSRRMAVYLFGVSRTLVVGSSTSISPVLIAIPPFRSIQRRDKPETPHRSNVCFRAEERARLHRAREPPPWRSWSLWNIMVIGVELPSP